VLLYPAVDIYEGRAVRLTQGDFDQKTVYQSSPVEAAKAWVEAGARVLHIIDLDGAKQGKPANLESLKAIVGSCNLPVQFGGGLRDLESIEQVSEAGADRLIIGTAALTDEQLLLKAVEVYGKRIVVSVDARSEQLATAGWLESSDLDIYSVIESLAGKGVENFIYTDISKDGTLTGPNIEVFEKLLKVAPNCDFVYAGGIGELDHIQQLIDLHATNLVGVIAGKSIYEQRFTITEATELLEGA